MHMLVNGIIAEYNPFHNGHKYHLEESLRRTKADYTVVVMSGDFVQRGAPAILDKHTRAEMALRCGADLVLEIPVLYATASAEYFAAGAVYLLDQLGVVTHLCFGSEPSLAGHPHETASLSKHAYTLPENPDVLTGHALALPKNPDALAGHTLALPKNPDALARHTLALPEYSGTLTGHAVLLPEIAALLLAESDTYRAALKGFLRQGASYPRARAKALMQSYPFLAEYKDIFSSPNNILGIEYCKAILRCHSRMIPVPIPRLGSGYHDSHTAAEFSSALAIRHALYAGEDLKHLLPHVPTEAGQILGAYLEKHPLMRSDYFSDALYYKLLMEKESGYERYLDVSEDLSNRIKNLLGQFTGFGAFCDLLKTKDMTYARISRCLTHILLAITEKDMKMHQHMNAHSSDIYNLEDTVLPQDNDPKGTNFPQNDDTEGNVLPQNDDIEGNVPPQNNCTLWKPFVPYARVLGLRKSAEPLLNAIKTHASIPLVTKLANGKKSLEADACRLLNMDILSSELYQGIAATHSRQYRINTFHEEKLLHEEPPHEKTSHGKPSHKELSHKEKISEYSKPIVII